MKNYWYTLQFDDFKLNQLIPQGKERNMPGGGDFLSIGKHFASLLVEYCGLNDSSCVLDVGCSVGRNAIPLTQIITKGEYFGFDVNKDSIEYATKHISTKYPKFYFQHINVFNGVYNRSSNALSAQSFTFPYDTKFDIVFLVSVFTHMVAQEVERYISEISRVTKKGGKILITYFLLNDQTKRALNEKRTERSFPYAFKNYHASDPIYQVGAIAYEQSYIEELYKWHVLNILHVLPGWWADAEKPTSCQDIIIAEK